MPATLSREPAFLCASREFLIYVNFFTAPSRAWALGQCAVPYYGWQRARAITRRSTIVFNGPLMPLRFLHSFESEALLLAVANGQS